MTFIAQYTLVAPDFISGAFKDLKDKILDLHRRAEVTKTFKDGDRLLDPMETPEHWVMDRPGKLLRDIFATSNGALMVSGQLKMLMEELDPGLHQFLPVTTYNTKDEREWFILNVHAHQNSIIDDRSEVQSYTASPNMRFSFLEFGEGPVNVTFSKAAMAGLNVWREQRYPGSLIISDAFEAALRNRNLLFFTLRKARDI